MFTLNDAMRLCDRATFDRGQQYWRMGRVVEVHMKGEGGDMAVAKVSGSERTPYSVTIKRVDGEVVASCTCPVGYNCKHAVAAILKLSQQRQTSHHQSSGITKATKTAAKPASVVAMLEQWLDELPRELEPPSTTLVPGKHYVLYALEASSKGALVHCYKGYLKKDYAWGSISSSHIEYYHSAYNAPSHVLADDVAIFKLLFAQRDGMGALLQGQEGGLALQRMINTGRLLLENPLRNLRRGPPSPIEMQWTQQENGASQLHVVLPGRDRWQLIPTEPAYYIDESSMEIGRIETSFNSKVMQSLRRMPLVPADRMPQVALQLRRYFDREQLPLPQEPDFQEENTPIPHLTVLGVNLDGITLPGLRLHWDYGPIAVQESEEDIPAQPALVEHDGRYYRIVRNVGMELPWLEQVQKAGFCYYDTAGQWQHVWLHPGPQTSDVLRHWQDWHNTLFPAWQQAGWRVTIDSSYRHKVHAVKVDVAINDAQKGWFDFALALRYGQWQLSTMEVVKHWLEHAEDNTFYLPNKDGDWLQIDLSPLEPIKAFVLELYGQKKLDKSLRLPAFQALALDGIGDVNSARAPMTRKFVQELRNFKGVDEVPVPSGLNAQLRPYQQHGLQWLAFLHRYGLGGILADDMGLGKTLQTLALLLHLKQSGKLKHPAMVVCPTSLVGNWRREAEHFAPALRVLVIHGLQREELFGQIKRHDLVITTYPLILRDYERYKRQEFTTIVADEAQQIKNHTTKAAQAIRTLKAQSHLCLSGTPLENHLGELWALMDFAQPGLLGNHDSFRKLFRQPIEEEQDAGRRAELARRVAPFLLRRTKTDVVKELPPKTEVLQYVELEGAQRQLYESIRVSMEARIRDLVKKKGMARSHIEFLDALLKLRQACIDPRLVKLDSAAKVTQSAKMEWLQEQLPQMVEEGRRILVFSQFTEVLALIETQLEAANLPFVKLTGKTKKRDEAIAAFQSGEVPVFLISLKAGGSGLNLTAADVVIHVDPWWNPAVENQATDRAYRIGQDKPVFVYKLVAENTVEERIQTMQQQKQALANALFEEAGAADLPASGDELLALLR